MENKLNQKENKMEQKRPKQIEEKLPEKILKVIKDIDDKRRKLVNEFLNITFQLKEIQNKHSEVFNKIKSANESLGQKIKYGFDKMKLGKKKDYHWMYNGKDAFIGHLKTPKIEVKPETPKPDTPNEDKK